MHLPETRYARAGDVDIAYATVGEGPVDLVWAYGILTHLELKWEEPSVASMLHQLAEFSRLILFDRRGCGLSDRGDRYLAPSLEERVADVVAVLDAVGSRRASLLGVSEGCALAVLFATMHPRRTDRIILYGGMSRMVKDEAHPWGVAEAERLGAMWEPVFANWGTVAGAASMVGLIAPSMVDDPDYVGWFARQQRNALTRDAIVSFMATISEYDVEGLLPVVRVPTLVLHRAEDTMIPSDIARHVASRIPGATLVELPGADHLPYVGQADAVVDAVRQFLAGRAEPGPSPSRQLVSLLATDASGPDAVALVRRYVRRFNGVEIAGPTSRPLARFDTATRAVRCGLGIVEAGAADGLALRVGVHTGECELSAGAVRGPAAQVPEALIALAEPGRVVVSGTVRDVVPGSGLRFADERRQRVPDLAGVRVVLTAVHPGRAPLRPVLDESAGQAQVFRRDGEYWTLIFGGRTTTLRDSKGMHDLQLLLADPGREHHVLDLWTDTATARPHPGHPADESLPRQRAPDYMLDDVAKQQYRCRLSQLDQQIDDATQQGDADTVATAKEERDRLVDHLASTYGIGGRTRRLPDEAERARKAIRRRIADAMHRIESANPVLGRHLRQSVHTGVFCSYTPERETHWETASANPAPHP